MSYTAVELTELVGDDIEAAFAPHDLRSIEVYWRGAWLCTAHPHDALSRTEQQRILDASLHCCVGGRLLRPDPMGVSSGGC